MTTHLIIDIELVDGETPPPMGKWLMVEGWILLHPDGTVESREVRVRDTDQITEGMTKQ